MRLTGFSDPSTNLLDRLDARLAADGAQGALLPIVPFRPAPADVRLEVRDPAWAASPAGRAVLASLQRTNGWHIVRFADESLAALGAALERGEPDPLATRVVAPARRWVVNFGDPNTTKALHVGHLRNVAIGNAVASAAEALGIDVVRQSRVGDFGRSMGEAMAGYLAHGAGRTPTQAGVKGDRLIGECYLRYVRALPARVATRAGREGSAEDGDAALSRERVVRGDAAEELLERWRQGDPAATRLFEHVRRWVTDGHDETYARLGVRVDRTLYESDYLAHGEALARRALDAGVIERVASGATMYPTGEPSYPQLLLQRRDGFPTQHLRYVATYDATRPLLAGARSIAVFGSEWRGLIRACEALLRRLRPGEEVHPTDNLMHEMVLGDGGDVVKSSKGGALLADQLFEQVMAAGPVVGLAQRHGRRDVEQLARIVLLGWFLGRPLQQRIPLALDELLDPRRNVGWSLAQAWARACDPRHDGAPDPDPADPGYRFVLVQSQRHRRLLAKQADELDLLPFVRFHYHLTRWFAGVPTTARIARAMRAVLGEGLVALGLADPSVATDAPVATPEEVGACPP
ncbi:MAG TPA: arginine--tRNA ligase [Conexibacter sp.]|jgi:arginyl-tRNA synthetase|nr:arginine--tRNA ligase [Conexibacter sp.]